MVRFGQPLHIAADTVVDGDVVLTGGPLTIDGVVKGDAAVTGGPLKITGEVHGDAVAIGGPMTLTRTAVVHEDAVCIGGPLHVEDGASILGESVNVGGGAGPYDVIDTILGNPSVHGPHHIPMIAQIGGWLFTTLAVLLFAALVTLLAPRATNVIATAIEREPGRVTLFGVVGWLVAIAVCIVLTVLCITSILVPFVLVIVAAALLVGSVGVSLYVGQKLTRLLKWRIASTLALTVIGVLALRATAIVGILPPLGQWMLFVVSTAVVVLSLGAVIMTKFGTDPTGTWLARRARAGRGNGDPIFVPDGAAVPGGDPAAPIHDPIVDELDEVTKEALKEIPDPDGDDEAGEPEGEGADDDAEAGEAGAEEKSE